MADSDASGTGIHVQACFQLVTPWLATDFPSHGPAILGNAAVQINVTVNTNLASRLSDPFRGPDGPVSWLTYAFRFMQFPLGLFGVAFASAMLPSVSRSSAISNFDEFRKTLSRCLAVVFLVTLPSSLGLIVLGRPIIGAIFQSGRFGAYDTQRTAVALSCYAIGLLGYAGIKILNPAFYALSDARTPMYVSLLSVCVNFCTALLLLKRFQMGYAALALSTSLVAIVSCLCLFETLRRKLGGIEGRYLVDRVARMTAASLLMTLAITATNYVMRNHLSATRKSYWGDLAICLPVGLVVLIIGSRAFHIHEIGIASDVFFAALRRVFLALRVKIRS